MLQLIKVIENPTFTNVNYGDGLVIRYLLPCSFLPRIRSSTHSELALDLWEYTSSLHGPDLMEFLGPS